MWGRWYLQRPKEDIGILKSWLQAVVPHQMWVLGTELRASGRPESSLNHRDINTGLGVIFLNVFSGFEVKTPNSENWLTTCLSTLCICLHGGRVSQSQRTLKAQTNLAQTSTGFASHTKSPPICWQPAPHWGNFPCLNSNLAAFHDKDQGRNLGFLVLTRR